MLFCFIMDVSDLVSSAFSKSEESGIQALLDNTDKLFEGSSPRSPTPEEENTQITEHKKRKVDEFARSHCSPTQEDSPGRTAHGGLIRKKRTVAEKSGDAHLYYDLFLECAHCGSLDCQLTSADIVCRECGTCRPSFGWDSVQPGFMEFEDYASVCQRMGIDKKRCVYRRSAYLDDLLDQFMGTARNGAPEHVFQAVAGELSVGCSIQEVRDCLRSKKLHKFYKFAGEIAARMRDSGSGGSGAPKMSQVELETFKALTAQAEKAFERVRGDRKNFLNFRYLALQLLSMLGRADLISELPPLKNKYRVRHHDELWERICRFNGWQFDPVLK